jgi:RHS repeat-associated protein
MQGELRCGCCWYHGNSANGKVTIQFTGKERDAETGLDYFGARYMSAAQGRFTTADAPFADQHPEDPQSWNMYTYVRNNPMTFMDPTGRAIRLRGSDEERQRLLGGLREAIGQSASDDTYLYEDKVTDKEGNTTYYVGVRTKGKSRRGPYLSEMNSAAADLVGIVEDSRVVALGFQAAGSYSIEQTGSGSEINAIGEGGFTASPGTTYRDRRGRLTVDVLDPRTSPRSATLNPFGSLDAAKMSDGHSQSGDFTRP